MRMPWRVDSKEPCKTRAWTASAPIFIEMESLVRDLPGIQVPCLEKPGSVSFVVLTDPANERWCHRRRVEHSAVYRKVILACRDSQRDILVAWCTGRFRQNASPFYEVDGVFVKDQRKGEATN